MTVTMFKAVLAQLFMDSSNVQNYIDKPYSIKWRILGIQYDKLGLAENGYRPQQIQWYRDTAREIDDEVKKLLEYDCPIGNEVYRDETGIYFLVGEDLGNDLSGSNIAELYSDLNDIKEEILDIFKEKSLDEFYPAIFLTKASRGLMNLGYLLEKAKENFLKADWSKKEIDICIEKSESGRAKGICQVCRQRLVFESDRRDEDKNICNVCYENKARGRIDKWLRNRSGETIWMDELKDKNGRVALVTMKFELQDWLNGDMLNSLFVRKENFNDYIIIIKDLLNLIKDQLSRYELKSLEINETAENEIKNFLFLYDQGGIYEPFSEIYETLKKNKNIDNVPEKHKNLVKRLLGEDWIEDFSFFDKSSGKITTNKKKNKIKNIQDYLNDDGAKDHLYKIFAINYLIWQIYNTLLERSIGDMWEEFICKELHDWNCNINKPLKQKIDFDRRKIIWTQLTDRDIEFLSFIILQFLLRKNPSPARLRRIWETTKEFFEDIKGNICAYAGISGERKRRYYWENVDIDDGEYYDGQAIFWAYNKKVYLISYLANNDAYVIDNVEDLKDKNEDEGFDNIRRYSDDSEVTISLKWKKAKVEYYQPYMSIIDPTPISWQFIIPAEYLPNLIDNVMKKYNEDFKFVYGRLPLHIGVIIQDYKKPLYVGIKALRRIRRDFKDTKKLMVKTKASEIKEKIKCQKTEESLNNTQSYYSLYWGKHNKGYEFFIKSDDNFKQWIFDIENIDKNDDVCIIPNTFDFEFLDTNVRRNDICYDGQENNVTNKNKKGVKRKVYIKEQRPYSIEEYWVKFKKFRDLFGMKNNKSITRATKLHNLISIIYDRLDNFDNSEGLKAYLATSFINIFDLKKDAELKDGVAEILGIYTNDGNFYIDLKDKMTEENLMLILDMFDFWHKSLKEV